MELRRIGLLFVGLPWHHDCETPTLRYGGEASHANQVNMITTPRHRRMHNRAWISSEALLLWVCSIPYEYNLFVTVRSEKWARFQH